MRSIGRDRTIVRATSFSSSGADLGRERGVQARRGEPGPPPLVTCLCELCIAYRYSDCPDATSLPGPAFDGRDLGISRWFDGVSDTFLYSSKLVSELTLSYLFRRSAVISRLSRSTLGSDRRESTVRYLRISAEIYRRELGSRHIGDSHAAFSNAAYLYIFLLVRIHNEILSFIESVRFRWPLSPYNRMVGRESGPDEHPPLVRRKSPRHGGSSSVRRWVRRGSQIGVSLSPMTDRRPATASRRWRTDAQEATFRL